MEEDKQLEQRNGGFWLGVVAGIGGVVLKRRGILAEFGGGIVGGWEIRALIVCV